MKIKPLLESILILLIQLFIMLLKSKEENSMDVVDMGRKNPTEQFVLDIRNRYRNERESHSNLDELIEDLVNEFYDGIGIKNDKFPVNVIQIAENLGFSIYESNISNSAYSGFMFDMNYVPDIFSEFECKRGIVINSNQDLYETLFTVAHEIGHFVLHVDEENNFFESYHRSRSSETDETSHDSKEDEDIADKFAAFLLMPKVVFTEVYKILKNKYDTDSEQVIDELSKRFFVPKESVRLRINELGLK